MGECRLEMHRSMVQCYVPTPVAAAEGDWGSDPATGPLVHSCRGCRSGIPQPVGQYCIPKSRSAAEGHWESNTAKELPVVRC